MTLLEREPALGALEGALGEVAHGEGRVALVYGEAGIGKTSLVDCFARARGQPGRTLWGACDSLHTPRPLGPVHDIAQQAGSGLLGRLEASAPHVWAWRHNPHGTFVDWNPKVSCEEHTAGTMTQSSAAHGARH